MTPAVDEIKNTDVRWLDNISMQHRGNLPRGKQYSDSFNHHPRPTMSSNIDICPSCKSILPSPDEKPFYSPLTPILGTNHVPSDSERLLGEEVVAQISADIANLEAQISRLQQFKNRLELYRKEHLSVLSKFRILPVEVIASIFVIYVSSLAQREESDSTSSYLDRVPPNLMDIPFTLASVCQQWRTIAISMPSLWINIDFQIKGRDLMRRAAQTIWCLSRSGNRHLNVVMDLRDARYSFKNAPLRWLDEIRDSTLRWREARIIVDVTDLETLNAVMPSCRDFPELKSLSLHAWPEILAFPLMDAPQLAEVEFYNIYIYSVPWHHFRKLHKLSLLQVKLSDALDALAKCDSLSHLCCEVVDDIFGFAPPIRLVHHTLVSLEVFEEGSGRDDSPLTTLLEYIELPALRDLTLAVRSWEDDPDEYSISHDSVWAFISDSRCVVKTFALERILISKEEWDHYAPFLSTLTVLKLTENRFCIYNDILESLAVIGEHDKVILPQLQRLEYNFYARPSRDSDYDTTFSLLVDTVKSRWEDNGESGVMHCLESIEVRGPRPERGLESFEAFHALRAFRRKGFDLEMYFL